MDYFTKVFSVTRDVKEQGEDLQAHEKSIKELHDENENMMLLIQRLMMQAEHDRAISEQAQKMLRMEFTLMLSQANRSLPPGEDRSAALEKDNEALKQQLAELKK